VSSRGLVAGFLVLLTLTSKDCGATAQPTTSRPAMPHQGFNFTTWSSDEYAGARAHESLRRLAATGANSIALIPTWYQRSRRSTRIGPDRGKSPTDESLAVIVPRAQELGLRVFLRPVVDTEDGTARAALRPRSVRAWFRSYRRFIQHYASLAERLNVDMLSVGLEYRSLDGPARTADWRRVIRAVRARFSGHLTYGANGADAWTRVRFWDALDLIGIDAYFPLSNGGVPSKAEIVRRWSRFTDRFGVTHRYLRRMGELARRRRKPIVFTELGYPSSAHALAAPWRKGGRFSGAAQRRALEAAFEALAHRHWFRGLYIWEWGADPSAGGRGDLGHTPQGKPAERSIAAWFGGRPAR
jgi:hypothetical protein